jgi:nitrogen fixation NifU-like protein
VNELRELYQEVIVDHNRRPRNFRALAAPCRVAHGHNRLCGDKLTLYADVAAGVLKELSFQGSGCAISTASASLLTEAVRGKSRGECLALFESFQRLVRGEASEADRRQLGKLEAFAGVGEFPARVKCATLAWHTLMAAFDERRDAVSTE